MTFDKLTHKPGSMIVERRGRKDKFNDSWYRGEHTHFIASKADLRQEDALEAFILQGWAPASPFIDKSTAITAFGSCFAANISRYLAERDYNVLSRDLDLRAHIIRFGEGMVNSFAIRQQLEWALAGRAFPAGLWIDQDKQVAAVDPAIRDETRQIILRTDVFVITLGLSEIWYDKLTGEAFWRAIPASLFDPERHGFRVSTVEENFGNIVASIELIQRARPGARVVLTLSPVPLMATFRPISCITASAVSKAILRVALDEAMTLKKEGVYYFPSYEMVTAGFVDPYKDDNRHPRGEIVERVMGVFERNYCLGGASRPIVLSAG
jgi:hypothetical protein